MNLCHIDNLHQHIDEFVSSNIHDPQTGQLLVKAGVAVSERMIDSLRSRGIDFIAISHHKPTDVESANKDVEEACSARNTLSRMMETAVGQVKMPGSTLDDNTLETIIDSMKKVIEFIFKNPTINVYMALIDRKDQYLLKHGVNVTSIALALVASSKAMRNILRDPEKGIARFSTRHLSDQTDYTSLASACLLHDIGKALMLDEVNEDIAFKEDDNRWEQIKQHPKVGHDILFGKNIDPHCLLGIKYHHENFDGTGYPFGIRGYKIHTYSRIIRIVDSFDAATAVRPGKKQKSLGEMKVELKEASGSHYDPEIVEHFIDMIAEASNLKLEN